MNPNIWLPSLSELVGYDSSHYYDPNGCWYAAMQGLNISNGYNVDNKGGTQWKYFAQYNQSGGGTQVWAACSQQISWLRSTSYAHTTHTWGIAAAQQFDMYACTTSHAVLPAEKRLTKCYNCI